MSWASDVRKVLLRRLEPGLEAPHCCLVTLVAPAGAVEFMLRALLDRFLLGAPLLEDGDVATQVLHALPQAFRWSEVAAPRDARRRNGGDGVVGGVGHAWRGAAAMRPKPNGKPDGPDADCKNADADDKGSRTNMSASHIRGRGSHDSFSLRTACSRTYLRPGYVAPSRRGGEGSLEEAHTCARNMVCDFVR